MSTCGQEVVKVVEPWRGRALRALVREERRLTVGVSEERMSLVLGSLKEDHQEVTKPGSQKHHSHM